MKKSFWGYNVQEVDTNMELLESAKAKLEKKVKSLTEELDSAREELKETKESLAIGSSTNSGELEKNRIAKTGSRFFNEKESANGHTNLFV